MHKLIVLSLSSVALLIPSISSALTIHGDIHPGRYTFFLTQEGSSQLKQANDRLARNPQAYTLDVNHTGITLLDNLQHEGFRPFFACQTRVRDESKREHTKHMLRLRREGQITGKQVPEIILLNSHDGSSSYQMLPGLFRSVCQNGLICGESFGEVRVSHKGNVVEKVIEGAYEVLGIFDRVEEKRDAMQSLMLPPPAQAALAQAALTYRFGEEHQPVTESQLLAPRRWQDESGDLWTTYQRIQENLIKGGLNGRNAKGGRTHI